MIIKYIKELDGLRGIAALMIMVYHFFKGAGFVQSGKIIFLIAKFSVIGQAGVTLFFVLSGFLISRILLTIKRSDNYFSHFYARRALRIFPLFYFFLLFTYFIIPLLTKTSVVPIKNQWMYWAYLQNFSTTFRWHQIGFIHLWSLAVEEQFYLFWPLLIYFLNIKQIKISIYFIFFVALTSRVLLQYYGYNAFYFTPANFDALAIGAFLAMDELAVFKKIRYVTLLTVFTLLAVGLWFYFGKSGNEFVQIIKQSVYAIIFYALIGLTISADTNSKLRYTLRNKFCTYSGKISYGLYIYHPLIFGMVREFIVPLNLAISILVTFVLTFAIASLSYYFIERPLLGFKRYFKFNELLGGR